MGENLVEVKRGEGSALARVVGTYLKNFLSEHTRLAYEADFRDFAGFLSENVRPMSSPKEIRKDDIISYREHLRAHYSPTSVNRKMSAISSLFKELKNAHIVDSNPADGIKRPPSRTRKERLGFTDREVNQVLGAYPGRSVTALQKRALLHFLFFTGVRISEALNVRVSDVSSQENVGIVVIRGKGDKLRCLPLHPKLYKTLLELISRMKKEPRHHLFTKAKGDPEKPITRQAAHLFLKKTLKSLGLVPTRSLHSSRRTVISNLLENGSRIESVAELAGHANINTTLRYNVRREPIEDNPLLTLKYNDI
jgi:site-specific recombinase XerD